MLKFFVTSKRRIEVLMNNTKINIIRILVNLYRPFYQASVYRMSHSWRAGKHSFKPSNVSALKLVLFKLSFLSCFIAKKLVDIKIKHN